ncbi:MAG: terminase small subunit [Solobacterium sp.]|nr:terminase small subunit [Solobacterium sp.]
MTEKQRRFCEEYVIDLDPVRAYMAVYKGCKKPETASAAAARLLGNVNVSLYVRELQQKVAHKALISAEDVVRDLITVKDRCMQAVPVQVWDPDRHCYVDSDSEFTFDSKGANTALKLLGDHLGMFQKKVEVTAGESEKSKLDDLISQMRGSNEH